LYRLSTRDRLVGAVVKYGVAEVESVTPTGISVVNASLPESGVAIQQNAAAPRSWRNNGNGTFTAEGGATLGGLFGGNWRERSGWPDGRVPESLRVGETVGRNELLIRHFDDNLAVPIVSRFGEYALACIRAFIVHNVAYPVRRVSDSEVIAFFAEYGVELIVNDLSGDKFDAVILNLPHGRTGRIAAVREWGRAGFEAARDWKRAGVDAVRDWRRRATPNIGDDKYVVADEMVEIQQVLLSSSALVFPTESRRITDTFRAGHDGIDIGGIIPGEPGDPIYAAMGGRVTMAYIPTWSRSQSTYIIIRGNDGREYRYVHIAIPETIQVGNRVTTGQQIATMSDLGSPRQVHLHFEVLVNNQRIDPLSLFPGMEFTFVRR